MGKAETVRRVVTGHDAAGRAVFRSDELLAPKPHPSGIGRSTVIWSTPTLPADNNDDAEGAERPAPKAYNPLPGGAAIRIVELPPGSKGPVHRTSTVDFEMILDGRIELELDDGATRLLGPGDIVVQRGTIHLWRNPSDTEPCRMLVVLIEARPYLHDSRPLEDVLP
jgi:quercetin dioxygenase-like cupin family protein